MTDLTDRLAQQPEAEATPPADTVPSVPQAEHEAAMAEKDGEIATLQAQVTKLNAAKDELETLKQAQADAEEAQRKETLKAFAQIYGLDTNEGPIAQAIDALDYEAVVAAATEKDDQQQKNAARPMADIGVSTPYGGILDKTNE